MEIEDEEEMANMFEHIIFPNNEIGAFHEMLELEALAAALDQIDFALDELDDGYVSGEWNLLL